MRLRENRRNLESDLANKSDSAAAISLPLICSLKGCMYFRRVKKSISNLKENRALLSEASFFFFLYSAQKICNYDTYKKMQLFS